MDFFEAQDQARRTTRWLVVIYILVAALLVVVVTFGTVAASVYFPPMIESVWSSMFDAGRSVTINAAMYSGVPKEVFVSIAVGIALVILLGTLFKSATLMSGGGKVAAALGGTQLPADVIDPLARRLRNVVEEMAIASGVPVPDIYVLEKEAGINAFAAGFTPSDAALTVTRGALEKLDRDELQGVIAHEFSHILNGDMRLNIRLMGLLFGITAINSAGRAIMIGGSYVAAGMGMATGLFGRTAVKSGATEIKILGFFVLIVISILVFFLMIGTSIMIFGVGLAALGMVGMISARIIKSAISRQREFLADASATQFTRQTAGIAGALKKIGGHSVMSYITAADPEQISHMLFGSGSKSAWTHPPLFDRIRALEPDFDGTYFGHVGASIQSSRFEPAFASKETGIAPESIADVFGQPAPAHVEHAKEVRKSIPDDLYVAAHSINFSYMLTLALILDRSGEHIERQMILVEEHLGKQQAGLVRGYQADVSNMGADFRLPLLELVFPALKRRPAAQLVELVGLADRLVKIDGAVDLYEFCFYRTLRHNLMHALNPSGDGARRRGSRFEVAQAAANVLTIVAQNGHENVAEARLALDAGKARLGKQAAGVDSDLERTITADILDQSLNFLSGLNGRGRRKLIRAICETATHDTHLSVAEGELIRVVCASLHCPLPPILADNK